MTDEELARQVLIDAKISRRMTRNGYIFNTNESAADEAIRALTKAGLKIVRQGSNEDPDPPKRRRRWGDLSPDEQREALEAYATEEPTARIAARYGLPVPTLANAAASAGVRRPRSYRLLEDQ